MVKQTMAKPQQTQQTQQTELIQKQYFEKVQSKFMDRMTKQIAQIKDDYTNDNLVVNKTIKLENGNKEKVEIKVENAKEYDILDNEFILSNVDENAKLFVQSKLLAKRKAMIRQFN